MFKGGKFQWNYTFRMVRRRWQGDSGEYPPDPGMQSIVTAVYDVPVGEVWSRESIAKLKKQVEDAGLGFDVIESIPVHEDIKLGKPTRDKYIEIIAKISAALLKLVLNVSATTSCLYLTGQEPS